MNTLFKQKNTILYLEKDKHSLTIYTNIKRYLWHFKSANLYNNTVHFCSVMPLLHHLKINYTLPDFCSLSSAESKEL